MTNWYILNNSNEDYSNGMLYDEAIKIEYNEL